jgi:hypothetical protein
MKVNPPLGSPRQVRYSQHETWRGYEGTRFVHDFGRDQVAADLWCHDPDAFEQRVAQESAFAIHRRAVRSI